MVSKINVDFRNNNVTINKDCQIINGNPNSSLGQIEGASTANNLLPAIEPLRIRGPEAQEIPRRFRRPEVQEMSQTSAFASNGTIAMILGGIGGVITIILQIMSARNNSK